MMCRMFDDAKKRCQEVRCKGCKNRSMANNALYEPLLDIDLGLGVDH